MFSFSKIYKCIQCSTYDPSHWCCYAHPAVVDWLLAAGADSNAGASYLSRHIDYDHAIEGTTPLMLAVRHAAPKRIIRALLCHGARFSAEETESRTYHRQEGSTPASVHRSFSPLKLALVGGAATRDALVELVRFSRARRVLRLRQRLAWALAALPQATSAT